MKTTFTILLTLLFRTFDSHAQLANGSIAPDFTLTDINGNSHRLYDYLDAGKTVYLDFFAAHCPTCWNYKNSGNMTNLYNSYGPGGTDEIMVIAIELDANNGYNELHGISGITQGDWVTPTPYPIINPEGSERSSIISAYAATFYPLIYGICPNRSISYLGTTSTANLYNYHTADCAQLGIKENNSASFFQIAGEKVIIQVNGNFLLTDLSGRQLMQKQAVFSGESVSLSGIPGGVYLIKVEMDGQEQTSTIFRP